MERVSAVQGGAWIRAGWRLMRLKPGIIIGSVILMYILLIVSQMLPYIGGILAMVIAPFLAGGVYRILQRVRRIAEEAEAEPLAREQPVSFDLMFSVFKDPPKRSPLLGLAAVALLFNLGVVMFVAWFAFSHLGGMQGGLSDPNLSDREQFRQLIPQLFNAGTVIWWLILLVVAVIYGMATLFAVPRIVLDGDGLVDAMKQSFAGVTRNWAPFLVYGVLWILLSVLVLISGGLALIVLAPLALASTFSAYRSIWPADPDEGESGEAPTSERSSTIM